MLRFFRVTTLTVICSISFSQIASAQEQGARPKKVAVATRTATSPTIDGDLSDPAWQTATWNSGFTQRKPINGAPPTFDTKFAVLFDDENIYVAIRCLMDGKTEITTRLTRRDRWAEYDHVAINISPRHDGLTAYEFSVNPDGVQRDIAVYGDNSFDKSWDAVWAAETTILEDEWTVEMEIPIDVLRFSGEAKDWGFQVDRWVSSIQEKTDFNFVPVGTNGWVSAAGVLTGVEEIEPQRPASITPETYVSFRDSTENFGGRGEDGLSYGAGGYAKFGLGSDSVLDLAVNPDFGQVEVDEVVLNLSNYEVWFPEKRPFFMEGAGLFKTPIQLFYSRRLGSPPPYPSANDDESITRGPASTPILGAAKFIGRSENGVSVGAIEAVLLPTEFTTENDVTGDTGYLEGSPWTSATVLRVNTEPAENITVGGMVTALNPSGSNGSYTGGADFAVFSCDREYVVKGQVTGSGRDDGVFEQDAASGLGIWTQLGKEGGEHFRYWGNYQFYSDEFDPNDLGYLRRNDLHQYSLFSRLQQMEKWGPLAEAHVTMIPQGRFNTDGLHLGHEVTTALFGRWLSDWVTEAGGFAISKSFDDRESRDGPPMKFPAIGGGWLWIRSPQRNLFGVSFVTMAHNTINGYFLETKTHLSLRLSRLEITLTPKFEHMEGALAYVDTLDYDDPENNTVIGMLGTDKIELGLSSAFVVTRDLSIQLLTQLLSVRANYSDYQLMNPDSSTNPYDYPDEDADFLHTDLVLQALLRWEYSPGSTLYAVYTHSGFHDLYDNRPHILDGIRNLKDEERQQLFMIKLSHRFRL